MRKNQRAERQFVVDYYEEPKVGWFYSAMRTVICSAFCTKQRQHKKKVLKGVKISYSVAICRDLECTSAVTPTLFASRILFQRHAIRQMDL